MILSSSLNTQQLELESIINCAPHSLQKQNQGKIGQRSIEWAAGLFEGEGCISYDKLAPNTRILVIGMTDYDVMQDFVRLVGYGNLRGPIQRITHGKRRKDFWEWRVKKRKEVTRILKLLLPYLGNRRAERAREALNHYETIM